MVDLPTGTVTFLFTDIEGSTARWEHQPGAMHVALARHDALLRQTIEAHGGRVFKTVGDAFCAVFVTAPAALDAALAIQRALQFEAWGDIGPMRVRMALHTGAAEERDGDYFGQPLNRVARLLHAGHGGQILLSSVVQELVCDQLPPSATLRDLGEYHLKDLRRPEHIFQLVAADLPSDFPALQTIQARPTNLPLPVTTFVGREVEVTAVCQLLCDPHIRLLTLTGPGGTGKTRLAQQVAGALLDKRAQSVQDGVWFVNLESIDQPALVASAIAQALSLRESGEQPVMEQLTGFLRTKQLLLVLDNFEQVVAAAPLVSELLQSVSGLKVLVTSRIVLKLAGEREFLVPPLPLPDLHDLPGLAALTQYAAVALFIQRAQAVKPDFAVTPVTAPEIAEICSRLDGLPLAIELAAARSRLLPPRALLQRLDQRLTLLTGSARDRPARQQTLRGTIDWSYKLLDEMERHLFAQLAVFVGGWTLDAAAAVCEIAQPAPDDHLDLLDGVQSLVDKSLLLVVNPTAAGQDDAEPRFGMLETIREYALEQLAASGEVAILVQQHTHYYLTLAETAAPELRGAEQARWLARLEQEHPNLRAAISRAEPEVMVRLCVSLVRFWYAHGHVSEGRRWLEQAVLRSAMLPADLRARALHGAGVFAWEQGDDTRARELYTHSLALWRELGDPVELGRTLGNLGSVALRQGNLAEASTYGAESLALFRAANDQLGIAITLNQLAIIALTQHDYERATQLSQEGLALRQRLGDRRGVGAAHSILTRIALSQGNYGEAEMHARAALMVASELGDPSASSDAIDDLAHVAAGRGAATRAARLWGAADALRTKAGSPLAPADRARYEQQVDMGRAQLDEPSWTRSWAAGRGMTLKQAIADALDQTVEAG